MNRRHAHFAVGQQKHKSTTEPHKQHAAERMWNALGLMFLRLLICGTNANT
jgi:hypothetical protein